MTQHTPGPWQAVKDQFGGTVGATRIDAANGHAVAYARERGPNGHDGEANARLIAAAPELLEALKELARLVHQNNALQHAGIEVSADAWGQMYQVTNEARAAIAKAEGGAS